MEVLHILGYISALIIGISLGLIGGGGSILAVPVLAYLFSINENLGKQIATIHNLGFYSWIIKKTKEKIK